MSEQAEPVQSGQTSTAKMGRPTTFSQETADELCEYLSIGESLRTACSHEGMPVVRTVFNWFRMFPDFLQQYTRAKEEAADALAEEVLDIADTQKVGVTRTIKADGSVEEKEEDMLGHRRLQIETRKWLMAKMKPKRYGDKLDLTNAGDKFESQLTGEQAQQLLMLRLERESTSTE